MWLASSRSEVQAHICLPVRGATPSECYYNLQHSIMLRLFLQEWYRVLSLRYVWVQSSGIILIP